MWQIGLSKGLGREIEAIPPLGPDSSTLSLDFLCNYWTISHYHYLNSIVFPSEIPFQQCIIHPSAPREFQIRAFMSRNMIISISHPLEQLQIWEIIIGIAWFNHVLWDIHSEFWSTCKNPGHNPSSVTILSCTDFTGSNNKPKWWFLGLTLWSSKLGSGGRSCNRPISSLQCPSAHRALMDLLKGTQGDRSLLNAWVEML